MVEAHEHVGAEPRLDPDRVLRRHAHPRAVIGRDEDRRLVVDLRHGTQADQLVAAAVGEDGPVPPHETMQAAPALHDGDTGSQRQVVRVAEDDLDSTGAHLCRVQRLHRGLRAHGHERRRAEVAVRGGDDTGARRTAACLEAKRGHAPACQQSMQSPKDRNR